MFDDTLRHDIARRRAGGEILVHGELSEYEELVS